MHINYLIISLLHPLITVISGTDGTGISLLIAISLNPETAYWVAWH